MPSAVEKNTLRSRPALSKLSHGWWFQFRSFEVATAEGLESPCRPYTDGGARSFPERLQDWKFALG